MHDELITGVQWMPLHGWDRESFLKAVEGPEAYVRCWVGGELRFSQHLNSIPLAMTWPQEDPELWLELDPPADPLKTRFDAPAWCGLRFRTVPRKKEQNA